MSNINRIFLTFFPSKNIILGAHFLKCSIFKPFYFLKQLALTTFTHLTGRLNKLFKALVVGFGPKRKA